MTDINVDIEEENIDLDISNDSAISLDIEDSTPIYIDLTEENIEIDISSDTDISIDIEGNAPPPTSFIDLTDVPNSYSGHSGKAVRVNNSSDGLEFTDTSVNWGEIGGTLSSQTDLQSALDLKADDLDLTSHTVDTTIHYTQGDISIPHTQINDWSTATTSFLTSETDPIFSAWDKSTGISITESQISDLKNYLDKDTDTTDNLTEGGTNKYDETVILNQGDNVTITGTYPEFTIASQDTTYTTSDFDIKDIADSTNLRTTWSGKQDELVSGTNIKTINSESLLGSTNISLQTPLVSGTDYEVPLTFTTGLTRTGNSISCDITQYEDSDAVSAIKADADWNATEWDTAYSWGDHADAGYQLTSEKGQNNGYASLDAGGKVPVTELPNSIVEYKGTWNATTNTPTLIDGTGNAGDVYIVSVAGTQNLGSGDITFSEGDWVMYNGTIWQKSINSNAVVSVNGQTGVVSLDTDDISEGTNKYDKTVALNQGDNITITGTYPEFTINAVDTTYNSSDFNLSDLGDVINTDKSEGKILKVDSGGKHIYVTDESGTDEKVKYDSEDPTAGYVADKIIAGTGISVAEGTGADENKLVITNSDKGSDVDLSPYAKLTDAAQDITANSFVTDSGLSTDFVKGDGSLDSTTYLDTTTAGTTYVPYSGATSDVDLGENKLISEELNLYRQTEPFPGFYNTEVVKFSLDGDSALNILDENDNYTSVGIGALNSYSSAGNYFYTSSQQANCAYYSLLRPASFYAAYLDGSSNSKKAFEFSWIRPILSTPQYVMFEGNDTILDPFVIRRFKDVHIKPNLVIGDDSPSTSGTYFNPQARLHILEGSTTLAPVKLTSGDLLDTPIAGAFEFLTDKPYFTITTSTARKEFALNDIALTSGRIPFITTNGRLTDDASLTYSTSTGLNSTKNIEANSFITTDGLSTDFVKGDGSLDSTAYISDVSGLVPYTGATTDVDLGFNSITANNLLYSEFPSNLDAYFRMDDFDGTKIYNYLNSNYFTCVNTTLGNGVNGSALNFNGSAYAYSTAEETNFNEGKIFFRFKRNAVSGNYEMLVTRSGGGSTDTQYEIRINPANKLQFIATTNVGYVAAQSTKVFNDTDWHNIYYIITDSVWTLYVDGVQDSIFNVGGHLSKDVYPQTTLGARTIGTYEYKFNGLLDDLMFFSSDAISDTERLELETNPMILDKKELSLDTLNVKSIFSNGELGINKLNPSCTLDVGGNANIDGTVMVTQYRLSDLNTAPSSVSDTGIKGEIRVTSTAIYICIDTDTWVKTDLATW